MTMQETFTRTALRRWWLFVLAAVVGAVAAGLVVSQPDQRFDSTTEFVVRPASGLSARDVPNALDALQPTGSLMNTLLVVFGSNDFVAGAARAAHVDLATASVEVSVRPGSVILEATTSTPTAASTRALTAQFEERATQYVQTKFAAYSLDRFSTSDASAKPSRSSAQAIGAGALLGILLAGALVAWSARRAWRRTGPPQPAAVPPDDLEAPRTKKAAAGGTP
jgi:hypothetical protein